MDEKKLKAMVLGLRKFIRVLVVLGWLPMIVIIVLKVLHIYLDNLNYIAMLTVSMAVGIGIYGDITRFITVVKYQKKNNCTFKQAWRAKVTYKVED